MNPAPDEPLDVLIVGAGISGIGMAAHLTRELPHKRFAILERREDLGGTWDLFRYPGVRSDSDMYTLGYSFAPWTGERSVASGREIHAYLRSVAEKHDIVRHIRFGHGMTRADWDSAAALWSVEATTPQGPRRLQARFLFCGTGYYDYANPHDARIPGIETFAGPVLHPQAWPQGFDPAGKRIAVIGSGATAVSLVPALAEAGAEVAMIQRTPSWYYSEPARDRIALALRKVLPARWAYALIRKRNTFLQRLLYARARSHPEDVADYLTERTRAELGTHWNEAAFTPPYGPWVQRLCLVPDGDFFAAIREGKARIVTGRIAAVLPEGLRMEDGTLVPADVIVTATGLRLQMLGGAELSVDGVPVDPAEHWYYRNCMFSGVPNFAALFGYLNAAWTARVDMVSEWLCRLMAQMDAWGADVVVPRFPDGKAPAEGDTLAGFTSGYLERGAPFIPKSAPSGPWRLSHDVIADRRALAEEPLDDGNLHFARSNRDGANAPLASREQLP